MTSIITGDIINSRASKNQEVWLQPLKKVLNKWGKTPKTWEIYRGDSFQAEIAKPEYVLLEAIKIKASIKEAGKIDVRMAIGIGNKTHAAPRITESNGDAFVNSGTTYDLISKTKKTLAMKSPWDDFDEEMNTMLGAALLQMNNWTPVMAQIVRLSIEHPDKTQAGIAKLAGKKSQSDISEGRARAGYDEIMAIEAFYRQRIKKYMKK